ncbi:MAG: hypothetical protein MRECE_21c004 [Mycoplasmataceae bacterium CE_OT135]|nr:MAG: hypothetical protein MRECE_21c004 [Mycoplasmataceae bacterium CE_OT135]
MYCWTLVIWLFLRSFFYFYKYLENFFCFFNKV